jgi:hypothetical protein
MQIMLLLKDSKNPTKYISNVTKFCQIYVVMWRFAKFMELYEVLPKLKIFNFFLAKFMELCQVLPKL